MVTTVVTHSLLTVVETAACYVYLAANDSLEVGLGLCVKLYACLCECSACVTINLGLRGCAILETLYASLNLLYLSLACAVLLLDVVEELLNTKHITVVSKRNTRHTICNGLVDKLWNACLTIEQRVLAMYV